MRIVYVEDNIANVHLVKRVARMGQHEIINYIDGMDALNNFENDDPDLVLMDIQLAGELTGIEVVKKIRERGHNAPIYAVTAYAMVGDRERCMEAGCTGYMSKPIPVPELVKLFQEYDKPAEPIVIPTPAEPATEPVKPPDTMPKSDASDDPVAGQPAQSDPETNSSPSDDLVAELAPPPDADDTKPTITNVDTPDYDTLAKTQASRSNSAPEIQPSAEGDDKLSDEDSDATLPSAEGENSTIRHSNNNHHVEMK